MKEEKKEARKIYPNVFYFQSISSIGGIESWFYYLSLKYHKKDITVLYRYADQLQIRRLNKRFRCIEWNGRDKIECENLFVNFNREILDYAIVYNKTYLVLHGDYLDMLNRGQLTKKNLPLDKRIDEYIGISKTVCDSWYKVTGIKPSLSYNPVIKAKPLKQLRLISAQRMSSEKGGGRIELLIKELDKYCFENDVDYVWDIFTTEDGSQRLNTIKRNKRVNIKPSRLDITRLYHNYDYLVALSDNEGYCYTVVESLLAGTPCVVTPLPVFKELGINDTNSITLNYNCLNAKRVIDAMYNKTFDFEYIPMQDSYDQFLIDKPNEYVFKEDNMARIKALTNYEDKFEKRKIMKGDVYETTNERAREITSSVFISKMNGEPIKFAEYSDEAINVNWQEPTSAFVPENNNQENHESVKEKRKKTNRKRNANQDI